MNDQMKLKGIAGLILNAVNQNAQFLGKGITVISAAELINKNEKMEVNYMLSPYWLMSELAKPVAVSTAETLAELLAQAFSAPEIEAMMDRFDMTCYRVLEGER